MSALKQPPHLRVARLREVFVESSDRLRLVLKQSMTPVVIGLATEIAAALALGRLIAAQLYQTSPHNPLLLAATAGFGSGGAARVPLSRAQSHSLLNPVQALRAE